MGIRTLFLILVLAISGGIAALNWAAFIAPSELDLVIVTISAPIGALMLIMLAVATLLYLIFLASSESNLVRLAMELQKAQQLASHGEGSRINELRYYLEKEFESVRSAVASNGGSVDDQ